jgi:hypothetical protein
VAETVEQTAEKYWAFLSYSHHDEAAACRLARKLESYRIPSKLSKDPKNKSPRRIFPIFRDRDEFSTSADLGAAVQDALSKSRSLVVLCSPASARSKWVNEEIRVFREEHGPRRIFAALLNGDPPSAFPTQLTVEADRDGAPTGIMHEPLWVDFRPGKESKRDARLRIIAAVLGVDYDSLKQRDAARRRLIWSQLGVVAVVVLVCIGLAVLSDMSNRLTMAIAWRKAIPPPTSHKMEIHRGLYLSEPVELRI